MMCGLTPFPMCVLQRPHIVFDKAKEEFKSNHDFIFEETETPETDPDKKYKGRWRTVEASDVRQNKDILHLLTRAASQCKERVLVMEVRGGEPAQTTPPQSSSFPTKRMGLRLSFSLPPPGPVFISDFLTSGCFHFCSMACAHALC